MAWCLDKLRDSFTFTLPYMPSITTILHEAGIKVDIDIKYKSY